VRLAAATLLLYALSSWAAVPDTVFLEELTWTEVRDALKAGKTTIILPTGGTEQNGPHMVLGKHNYIVKHTAERIARALGNALVAPVMAYVPEGNLDPPTGHMAFPGSITLPDEHFTKVVEYAARSFKASGFRDIVLIGDSGPNQKGLKAVAERLNKQWVKSGVRIHYSAAYYNAISDKQHAGMADTSQLMAVDPKLVRMDKRIAGSDYKATGVSGDPTTATVEYGRKALDLKVEAAVEEIRASLKKPRS
jgi:creatinine amidohydrolase